VSRDQIADRQSESGKSPNRDECVNVGLSAQEAGKARAQNWKPEQEQNGDACYQHHDLKEMYQPCSFRGGQPEQFTSVNPRPDDHVVQDHHAADQQTGVERFFLVARFFVWQRGSIAQLKLINRPAILSLVDANGASRQVVLAGLDGDRTQLLIGASAVETTIADLADYWFGEFIVLWRPQAGALRPLRAGMRGDDVRWLRQGLQQLGGLPASVVSHDFFDADLERLVEDFQRSRRLAVDGVAGVQTQLVLDAALGLPGTPTLAGAQAESGA